MGRQFKTPRDHLDPQRAAVIAVMDAIDVAKRNNYDPDRLKVTLRFTRTNVLVQVEED